MTSFLSYCFSALLILLVTPIDLITTCIVIDFAFFFLPFFKLEADNQILQTLGGDLVYVVYMELELHSPLHTGTFYIQIIDLDSAIVD